MGVVKTTKTTITKAELKKIKAAKKTAGKIAKSASAKKNALAMKKAGERHFRQEGLEPCVGGYLRCEVASSHSGHEEDLGLHQVAQAQRGPHHQARQCAEGGLPRGESRHVEDGLFRQQAPVLRP